MCQELLSSKDIKVRGLHFYTLNLETSVLRIVEELQLVDDWVSIRELPWRPPTDQARKEERVRPIFWALR